MSNEHFTEIATEARQLAKKNTHFSPGGFLVDLAAFVVTGVDLSLSQDPSRQHEAAMPDDWLGAVAELEVVSPTGLNFLSKALAKKGWVSVAEAVEFISKEEKLLEAAKSRKAIEQKSRQQGASQLLARAERERPGTLDTLMASASEVTEAAAGVVSFTIEKTLWVGKGLGIAAGALRGLRREI